MWKGYQLLIYTKGVPLCQGKQLELGAEPPREKKLSKNPPGYTPGFPFSNLNFL